MITIYFRYHHNNIYNPKNPIVSAIALSIPEAKRKGDEMTARGYEFIKAVDCGRQAEIHI